MKEKEENGKFESFKIDSAESARVCNPHFKDQTTLETQSKIHTFNFSKPTFNVDPKACNNTPEITEVVLHAGDCFYFPAGMYHEVCCIDDELSISINVSLIYTNYAELVTQGIYQLLLKDEKWRQGIDRVYSPNDLRQKLDNLLKTLKTDIGELKAEDFVPEKGLVDIVDKDNILIGKGIDESREKKAEKVSDSFRANPLAVLIPVANDLGEKEPNLSKVDQQDILMDEDGELLIPEDTEDRPEITEDMIKYVLHINWGNDEFESLIRVAFYLPGKAKTFVEELRKVLLTTDRNQNI
ncbi:hypothetical protein ABK040_013931 [Willaertia magna]